MKPKYRNKKRIFTQKKKNHKNESITVIQLKKKKRLKYYFLPKFD